FVLHKDQANLTLSRNALIEGDAVAVRLACLVEPLGLRMDDLPDMQALLQASTPLMGEQFQVYARAPLILRQQLVFPYVHGLAFIKEALAHGGWAGLDNVYRHPPVSTAQIMHPEKYFTAAPELPREGALELPAAALGPAWKKLKRDVLGEFLLSVVLQQFLPADEARQSAAGWRGDRYELFEHQATRRLLLVCLTVWDTPQSSTRFFQSYTKLIALKYPGWVMRSLEDQSGNIWQQGQSVLLLRQHEYFVELVEG